MLSSRSGRRGVVVLALAALVVLPAASESARSVSGAAFEVVVTVRVSGTSCRALPVVVPAGPVRFELSNRAKRPATFSVGGRSASVRRSRPRAVVWSLPAGPAPYRCRVGSKVVGRGALTLTPPPPNASIAVTGEPEVVFDHTNDRCDEVDLPDAPARVFRDAEGRLQLVASNHMARRMVGTSLDDMARDCRVVLPSHGSARPERFDDSEWLMAPYTLDGRTIHALVHMEYHGQDHGRAQCPSGRNDLCWYDAITLAVSRDGGATYTHAEPPAHVVAAPPWEYRPDNAGLGYMGLSNLVRNPDDGYYYAMVGLALPFGYTGSGVCLIRGRTLDRADAWRFWNGSSFAGRFVDPYEDPTGALGNSRCRSIVGGAAWTLSWNTYVDRWVVIGTFHVPGPEMAFFLSMSSDLVHWSNPQPFLGTEGFDTYECGDDPPTAYASFIDPSSPARNFDVTGKSGWLYYTQFNPPDCNTPGTYDRDLVRIPIELAIEPAG
jgi:hypothetical protein